MSIDMDTNIDDVNVSDWVDECLSSLDVDSEDGSPTDAATALSRVHARRLSAKRRRKVLIVSCVSLCGVLLLVAALPSTRIYAQRLLARFDANRFEALPVAPGDFNRLPGSVRGVLVNPPIAHTPVANMEQAISRAGFVPRLPQSDGLGRPLQAPKLTLVDSIHKQSRISVDELRMALQREGIEGVLVPQSWDGAQIDVDESVGIAAEYDHIYLAQRLPLKLEAPQDFSLDQFLEVLFRIVGLNAAEAANLRQKYATHPADFLTVPPRLPSHEVQLPSGPGLVLENFHGEYAEGMMLIWSTPDRVFFLTGKMAEAQAIAIAESLQ
jgi:hypothetical protein